MLGLPSYSRQGFDGIGFDSRPATYGFENTSPVLPRYKRDELYPYTRGGTPPPTRTASGSPQRGNSIGSPASGWSPGTDYSSPGRSPTPTRSGSPSSRALFDNSYGRSYAFDRDGVTTPSPARRDDYTGYDGVGLGAGRAPMHRDINSPKLHLGSDDTVAPISSLTNSEAWDKWWAEVTARRRDTLRRREDELDAGLSVNNVIASTPAADREREREREKDLRNGARLREKTPAAGGTVDAMSHSPAPTSLLAKTLPAGWIDARDPATGRVFYHNTNTGVSVWEHPALSASPVARVERVEEPASPSIFTAYKKHASTQPVYAQEPASSPARCSSPQTYRRQPSMEWHSDTRFLIPPQDKKDEGKYVVVLDLDETLVYAREGPLKIRPGCRELLMMLASQCEVIVWTAGERCYAHTVLDDIDPRREYVRHCVYRHPKWFTGQQGQMKDIRLLDRAMDKLVMVENTPDCIRGNIHNGIIVSDYLGKAGDTSLFELAKVLQTLLRSEKSVSSFLQGCANVRLSSVPTDIGDSIVVYCVGDVVARGTNQDISNDVQDRRGTGRDPTPPRYGVRPFTPVSALSMHPHLRVLKKSLT